ncbi:ATP-binding protein [Termitidicoccus mucosus]|uniref:ATP-binding protein n=1 Tax=Termitidicoccus mucosus TaxID=1184151 RepID=A0A178IQT5_9BACT|nr:hypothetical protein AW736_02120 [Opitutaceae bacterium TSB47]
MNTQNNIAGTIKVSVNQEKLTEDIAVFFSHDGWLKELFQNAVRAGATHIAVTQTPDQISIVDNGCGLKNDPEAWMPLLGISTTGWNQDVQTQQHPAGMGLLAALTRFPATIQSKGWAIHVTPETIKKSTPISIIKDGNLIQGFSITLNTTLDIADEISGRFFTISPSFRKQSLLTMETGSFLHPKNQPDQELVLDFRIIDHEGNLSASYQGTMRKAPWACINADHTIETVNITQLDLDPDQSPNSPARLNNFKAPFLRPIERRKGFDIWVAETSTDRHLHPNFHYFGMSVYWNDLARGIYHGQNNLGIQVSIHGDIGYNLELKKPDRESLIINAEATRFLNEIVLPFHKKAVAWVKAVSEQTLPYEVLDQTSDLDDDFTNNFSYPKVIASPKMDWLSSSKTWGIKTCPPSKIIRTGYSGTDRWTL